MRPQATEMLSTGKKSHKKAPKDEATLMVSDVTKDQKPPTSDLTGVKTESTANAQSTAAAKALKDEYVTSYSYSTSYAYTTSYSYSSSYVKSSVVVSESSVT